jgi:hypothetical protein
VGVCRNLRRSVLSRVGSFRAKVLNIPYQLIVRWKQLIWHARQKILFLELRAVCYTQHCIFRVANFWYQVVLYNEKEGDMSGLRAQEQIIKINLRKKRFFPRVWLWAAGTAIR